MSYLSAFIQHSLQPARMVSSPNINASAQDNLQSIPPVDPQDRLTRETMAPTSEQPAATAGPASRSVSEGKGRSESRSDPAPTAQDSAINVDVTAIASTQPAPRLTTTQHPSASSEQRLPPELTQPPGSEEAQHWPDAKIVIEPTREEQIAPARASEKTIAEHHKIAQQIQTKAINSTVSEDKATVQSSSPNIASLAFRPSAATMEPPFADPVSKIDAEAPKAPALSPRDNPSSTAVAHSHQPPAAAIVRPHTVQSEQRQQPQTTPLPQVRIGHINVLIDDQAGTKPARKEATSSAGASQNPFGLRGL